MRSNELWICPDTEPPGLCPCLSLSTMLVVGPFEGKEEGTGVTWASHVLKVKGEDSATPGSVRGDTATGRGDMSEIYLVCACSLVRL